SGVPKKTRRRELNARGIRRSRLARRALFGELLAALLHVQAALQSADAIDEEDAVEMVDLVLDADGAQPFGALLDRIAVEIEAAQQDLRVALDGRGVVGNGEAALLPGDPALALADHRIDHDPRVAAHLLVA